MNDGKAQETKTERDIIKRTWEPGKGLDFGDFLKIRTCRGWGIWQMLKNYGNS